MTRPKIWKEPRFDGRPWCATHPDKPETWQLCETWREAVEFVAEKLANPFPLELEWRYGNTTTATYNGYGVFITEGGDGDMIALARHHWRPLARALTRLADNEGVK